MRPRRRRRLHARVQTNKTHIKISRQVPIATCNVSIEGLQQPWDYLERRMVRVCIFFGLITLAVADRDLAIWQYGSRPYLAWHSWLWSKALYWNHCTVSLLLLCRDRWGGGGLKSSQGDDRALHSLFAEKPRRVEYRNRKRFLDVLHEGLSRFVGKTYRCIHQAVPEFQLFATFFSCTFGLARLCCYFDLLPPLNVFGW